MLLAKKTYALGFDEAIALKRIFPDQRLGALVGGTSAGNCIDFKECMEKFPKASYGDLEVILKSKKFIEWYNKNGKKVMVIIAFLPYIAKALAGLPVFHQFLSVGPQAVPCGTFQLAEAAVEATEKLEPSLPAAFTAPVKPGLLSDKGYILLHIMVLGFISLVISTFLKFTGRGDLIPLITFVGGCVVLYECIGLFWSIYESIVYVLTKGF